MEIDRIVDLIAEASIKRNEAVIHGDAKAARKYGNKVITEWKRLLKFGDHGKEKLCKLLTHENPSARVAAASFLLEFRTEEALGILRELTKGQGFVAFLAQESLKRWEEGKWALE